MDGLETARLHEAALGLPGAGQAHVARQRATRRRVGLIARVRTINIRPITPARACACIQADVRMRMCVVGLRRRPAAT